MGDEAYMSLQREMAGYYADTTGEHLNGTPVRSPIPGVSDHQYRMENLRGPRPERSMRPSPAELKRTRESAETMPDSYTLTNRTDERVNYEELSERMRLARQTGLTSREREHSLTEDNVSLDLDVKSTKNAVVEQGLKFLIFGKPGAGKTYLASTTGDLERTLIVSAEGGMVTLRGYDIDVVEVRSLKDIQQVYKYLNQGDHSYRFVFIDSASEVAEITLEYEEKRNKDGRAAYGEMGSRIKSMMRRFKQLPMHVVMVAKLDRYQDGSSYIYRARFPGNILKDDGPHQFDEVYAMRVWQRENGDTVRRLQCQADGQWEVKSRAGVLEQFEEPHIGQLIEKIQNTPPPQHQRETETGEDADDAEPGVVV